MWFCQETASPFAAQLAFEPRTRRVATIRNTRENKQRAAKRERERETDEANLLGPFVRLTKLPKRR